MAPFQIKTMRLKLGMTQNQLAILVGVSFQTVNRWEGGKSKPCNLAIEKLKTIEANNGK